MLNYYAFHGSASLGEVGAEEEWVVMVQSSVTDAKIEELCHLAKNGCKLSGKPSRGGVPFFEMRGTEHDLEAIIQSSHGAVKYVEVDEIVEAVPELESDHMESSLWGLERIGAYKRSSHGNGVSVFVLDTGVRTTHQEFGSRAISTLDLTSGALVECHGALDCAADRDGHGTHCAGSAAGTTYGVAPGATVRGVKVLADYGGGQFSWILAALDWMATSSIRPAVASLSLGGSGTHQTIKDSVDAATSAGVTVVTSAGNSNSDACNYSPAFVPSAITVGSTDSLDRRSTFSNYGSCTNIWAPGSSILSADHISDIASTTKSGTSMACPHVSGGAALVLQQNPSFNYAKVLEALHADAITDAIADLKAGDTNSLLYVGEGGPPPTPAPTPAPPIECPSHCETFCRYPFCIGCC